MKITNGSRQKSSGSRSWLTQWKRSERAWRERQPAQLEAAKLQIESDQLQNALADEKQASSALEVMVENLRGQIADGSRALRESTDREAAASKTLAVARQKYEIAISEMNSKLRKSEEKSKSTLEELSRRQKMPFPQYERADRERIANAESKYDLQAQLSAVREDLVRERGARRRGRNCSRHADEDQRGRDTKSRAGRTTPGRDPLIHQNRITKELSGALRDILKFFEDSLDSDEMFSSTFSTRHHAYSSSLLLERAKRALQVASKQRNRTKSMHRIKEKKKKADAWHRWGYCKLLSIVC